MATLTISLPDALKSFIDEQVAARGFGSGDAYVRALINQDADRQRLRTQLVQGAHAAPASPVDDSYFEGLRAQVRQRGAR